MAIERHLEEITNKRDLDKTHVKSVSKNDNVTEEVDFDELISSAGEFGRYQVLLFISTFPFYWYGVFAYFTQLFLTEVPQNHWCWIPELENFTVSERRNLAIPLEDNSRFGYAQCKAYVANWTDVLITRAKPDSNWNTTKCQYGWEFDKNEIPYPTISTEMGWVCEKNSYQATAQAIFFLGSIVGGFVIGWVADRFGRLPATVISNMIGCVGGIISIFARNFTEFALYRFFMGMAYDNCMMMVYLLVLEYVAPKYRTLISNASFALFYSSAVTSLPWIALACGHWKTISLVTSVPFSFAILVPFVMPESPRWLLSRGRVDDAVKKILTIGRINKKEVPPKLIEKFKDTAANAKKEENGNILELLRRPFLRKMFIYICLEYICCALVFDALVRSIGQLDYDFFLSFSVVSATEFPSILLIAFILDWMGRRWLTTISMTISCIFSILTVFVGGGLPSVICAVIARFTVNMAYGASMQWAAEMLPVSVRGSGASIVHICGFVGTIISPYIVYLENKVYWLPLVVVGCVAGLGAVIALLLPETAKKEMPQSFDDAENLVKFQSFWEVPCFSKKAESDNKIGAVNDCFEM